MHRLDSKADHKRSRILAKSKQWAIPQGAKVAVSVLSMGLPLLVGTAVAQEPQSQDVTHGQYQDPAFVANTQAAQALARAALASSASSNPMPKVIPNVDPKPSTPIQAPVHSSAPAPAAAPSYSQGLPTYVPVNDQGAFPAASVEPTSPTAAIAASIAAKQAPLNSSAAANNIVPPSARLNQGGGIMFNHKHDWYFNEQLESNERINLSVKLGGMSVPMPSRTIDYAVNKQYMGHGNAHYDGGIMRTDNLGKATSATPEENPLASPYYDPFTGEVNIPESVKAQQRRDRIAAEQQRVLNDEENRLAQYDIDRAKQLGEDPNYRPFGNFESHDRIYKRMPLNKNVFYVSSGKDIQWLHNQIAPIERDLGADIGFVIMDQNGLVALKDNSPFPLYGMSKFHLAYAVGALMSVRGEVSSQQIKFNMSSLNRSIPSPLIESLTGANIAQDSTTDPASANSRNKSQRNAMLANAGKQLAAGTTEKSRAEARANSKKINSKDVYGSDESNPNSNNMTISLGELMFYSLSLGDSNASAILHKYLGSVSTLEVFDKTKGLEHVQYKTSELDTAISPVLVVNNNAPLYESAKLMANYFQDKEVSPEVRLSINDMMHSNQATRNLIQKGVKASVADESAEVLNNLMIYSQGQASGYISERRTRPVVSDLAMIEYRGQRIVMAIACRDIKGPLNRTQAYAEDAIAEVARILFEYEKYRINSRNF